MKLYITIILKHILVFYFVLRKIFLNLDKVIGVCLSVDRFFIFNNYLIQYTHILERVVVVEFSVT